MLISLIVLAIDALHLYLYPALPVRIAEPVVLAASALAAMGVFLLMPAMIVRIWKTGPLPPGPLRDRLEDISRRLKLRYRHILVWRSGGMVANAGVMGIVGPLRYVLLSDALLEQMPERAGARTATWGRVATTSASPSSAARRPNTTTSRRSRARMSTRDTPSPGRATAGWPSGGATACA